MAEPLVFTNAQVYLGTASSGLDGANSFDLSGYLTQVRLTRTYDQHDTTVMGMDDHRTSLGLGKWSAACTVMADFGAGGIDTKIFPLIGPSQINWLYIRPVRAARGATNPEYYGQVNLADYNPMDGNVGDPLKTPLTFVGAGSLQRTTAAT